ncbi:MAG: MASE1 domain-containing protein [Planctomycetota bacterium]
MRARGLATIAISISLTAIYFVVGKLSLQAASVSPSASPVWPTTGLALAALILLGTRHWPAVLVGAFLVNASTLGYAATSFGIAVGNTLEAVLGAALTIRFAHGRRAFDRPFDYLRFVVLAGLSATAVSATFGVTSLYLGGFAEWPAYSSVWTTWWLGDAGGALIVAPLVVLWGVNPRLQWSRPQIFEALLLLASLCAVGEFLFLGDLFPELTRRPLGFLCIPPLLWAAFRFGPRETATALAILTAIATWGTLRDLGPYAGFGENESLLLLQAFLAMCSVTAMCLAAVVRQRGRAHQALQIQAVDLARSNADLEHFADVVSHDLQEPLRSIRANAQLLALSAGGLDSEGRARIDRISRGAQRMQQLVTDLLAYGRVGARGARASSADGAVVMREVLEDMRSAIEESGARVDVGPLPLVHADRAQFGQLLRNLIGNAIKFRRSEPPEVLVRGERCGRECVFSVRDNGIGIEMGCAERIFGMFARLHPHERFPGTGIGLAICKKIVQGHGGRIWVESEPGNGSTFFFTLPAAE